MADEAQPVSSLTKDELQARVYELEAELQRKERALERAERASERRERRPERRETESARKTIDRTVDEANRTVRGLTLAYLEGLRTAANAVEEFAREVERRNPPDDDDDDADDLARNLPRDLYSGYLKAVNRALKIPENAIDKFYETYHPEEKDKESRSRKSG
jgi:hypothetical protein